MSQHLTLEGITIAADINTLGGGGTPGNSRWGVPPVSPNPDPVSEQKCHFPPPFSDLAPVVQTLDSAIHRINHYPADKYYASQLRYPLDSDLSGG